MRIDEMGQSGYGEPASGAVLALSTGQAAEVVRSDINYFRESFVRQVGSTRVTSIQSWRTGGEPGDWVRVELDVSGVEYERAGRPVITNVESSTVITQLEIVRVGGCLLVANVAFL